MKTTIIREAREEPNSRADVVSVVRQLETLPKPAEATTRSAEEYRGIQNEFHIRADAAWARFQKTGKARLADQVIADLQSMLDAKRLQLQG